MARTRIPHACISCGKVRLIVPSHLRQTSGKCVSCGHAGRHVSLPFAPLQRQLELHDALPGSPRWEQANRVRSYALAKAYSIAVQRGEVSIYQADMLCVKLLNMHPAEIYGDLWWDLP